MTNTTIFMTRGDSQNITVSIVGYTLTSEDTVVMTIRKDLKCPIVLQLTADQWLDGKAVISIAPEDTQDLKWGEYIYDIQLTYSSGDVVTIVKPSKFVLGEEVTYA